MCIRDRPGAEFGGAGGARGDWDSGDAAGEGLSVGQARCYDAGTTGGDSRGDRRDKEDLRDHVQRAARSEGRGEGRRVGEGWSDWAGGADHQYRTASDCAERWRCGGWIGAAGVVLGPGQVWWDSDRHRVAPGGPVSVLHGVGPGAGCGVGGRECEPQGPYGVSGLWQCNAAGQSRRGLCAGGLVYAEWVGNVGRWAAVHPRDGRLYRTAEVHRYRGTTGRQSPVYRRPEADAVYRLQQRVPAVWAAVCGGHREPDACGAGPEAMPARSRTGAEGAERCEACDVPGYTEGLIAMHTRRRMDWNSVKERFLKDAAANAMLARPQRVP